MMNGLGEKRFRAFSPSSYSKHKQAVETPDYAGSFYMKNLFYDDITSFSRFLQL
jgi:hypothetical protein